MTTTESPACTQLPPGWECSLPAGHPGACAAAPVQESGPAPERKYGFSKKVVEQDLELPSGDVVRIRKLTMNHLFKLRLTELRDVFTADLLSDTTEEIDDEAAQQSFEDALLDPERGAKLLEPIDRVVAAAVLCPKVVIDGPTNDEQINVDEIDMMDKLLIFSAAAGDLFAAFGGQQEALKSVQRGSQAGL